MTVKLFDIFTTCCYKNISGAVAQMGEYLTGSQGVEGSIPFSSTNFIKQLHSIPPLSLKSSILPTEDLPLPIGISFSRMACGFYCLWINAVEGKAELSDIFDRFIITIKE
jgi:hypothetical protein